MANSDEYFKSSQDTVIIPNSEFAEDNKIQYGDLVSDVDIEHEVHKETVTNVIIKETDSITYPMVCIRADKVGTIQPFALDGLRALIKSCYYTIEDKENGIEDDSINIYIYTKTKILQCGKASYNKIYKYLDNYIKDAMSEKMKVYRFESETEKQRIDKMDAARIKLDI